MVIDYNWTGTDNRQLYIFSEGFVEELEEVSESQQKCWQKLVSKVSGSASKSQRKLVEVLAKVSESQRISDEPTDKRKKSVLVVSELTKKVDQRLTN